MEDRHDKSPIRVGPLEMEAIINHAPDTCPVIVAFVKHINQWFTNEERRFLLPKLDTLSCSAAPGSEEKRAAYLKGFTHYVFTPLTLEADKPVRFYRFAAKFSARYAAKYAECQRVRLKLVEESLEAIDTACGIKCPTSLITSLP